MRPLYITFSVYVSALDKISASDWLRRQVLASQSEVVCICTLSAFYHMAKQHSKWVSTQATDRTTTVQYIYVHNSCPSYCPRSPQTASPKNNTNLLPNQEYSRNFGMNVDTAVVAMTYFNHNETSMRG